MFKCEAIKLLLGKPLNFYCFAFFPCLLCFGKVKCITGKSNSYKESLDKQSLLKISQKQKNKN